MFARKPHDRVMERVVKRPASEGGCWEWQGARNSNGYGVIRVGSKRKYVHRVMAAYYGHTIDGLTIDHLCRNVICVRESHLEVVSREENTRREKSAAWKRYMDEQLKGQHLSMEFAPGVADPARQGYRKALAAEATIKHMTGQPFTVEDLNQQYRWLVSLTVCDGCRTVFYAPIDTTPDGFNVNVCGDCVSS